MIVLVFSVSTILLAVPTSCFNLYERVKNSKIATISSKLNLNKDADNIVNLISTKYSKSFELHISVNRFKRLIEKIISISN